MPELPEVETTVRALRRAVVGRRIKSAAASAHQLFETRGIFRSIGELLAGDAIERIERHGKYPIFRLVSGRVMVAHMKMTGHFLYKNKGSIDYSIEPGQFIRFSVEFADGAHLLFSDIRKFGRFWLMPGADLENFFAARKLGRDALSNKLTPRHLKVLLCSNRNIKALLLDQTRVAGIGNIYADEILWAARIHPKKKGVKLTAAEVGRIHAAMRTTLKRGIRAGGASIRDYRHPDGSAGNYQTIRKVYGHTGLPCPRCGARIKRIVIGQRSSHFCPRCQLL